MDTTTYPRAERRESPLARDSVATLTPRSSWAHRLVTGNPEDPRWVRPALAALMLGTLTFYLYGLSINGWANSFYSAAVQAGSQSWKAFFYGSSDAANSITVDKPPASLWIMALSVRVFGLSSWSILVPQSLMGVASVGVLYATVRRHFGAGAGLLAGVALATTPVAVLMFRFNNPDALLVLLLTIAAWATVRAVEQGSTRWLVLVGVLVGFGFLTKMLQALLIVPGIALAFLVAAPISLGSRIRSLLWAGLAMVVSAGWWIAIVELVPAADRPYIGGSQRNSILELTLGYNGFGRLTGNETGSVGGGGTGTGGVWGTPSLVRLFTSDIAGNIAWLLPAALVGMIVGFVLLRHARRTDGARASFIVWGGWLLVTGLCFSLMAGIFHEYYTVALAPAIAALVGMGATVLWRRRRTSLGAAITLSATLMGSLVWAHALLTRAAGVYATIGDVALVAGGGAALLVPFSRRLGTVATRAVATVGILAVLAGPIAYSVDTVTTAKTGSIVTAGPSTGSGMGRGRAPGGMGGGGAPGGGNGGGMPPGGTSTGAGQGGTSTGTGQGGTNPGSSQGGGMGSLLAGSTSSAAMTALLKADADSYTWAAAAIGSQNAAGYQLASERPVMAIGGFNGSDPSPTLAQFKAYVAAGKIHYFIGGSMSGGGAGGSGSASEISTWVAANFSSTTVDGVTLYDLTAGS